MVKDSMVEERHRWENEQGNEKHLNQVKHQGEPTTPARDKWTPAIFQVKSPSDMTIYAPGLNRVNAMTVNKQTTAVQPNLEIIDVISNFVESVRKGSNRGVHQCWVKDCKCNATRG